MVQEVPTPIQLLSSQWSTTTTTTRPTTSIHAVRPNHTSPVQGHSVHFDSTPSLGGGVAGPGRR